MAQSHLTRSYRGKPQQAAERFAADAQRADLDDYVPVSQMYVPGHWSGAAIVLALLSSLFLIGFPILVYMLIVKPAGTLVVTYAPHLA